MTAPREPKVELTTFGHDLPVALTDDQERILERAQHRVLAIGNPDEPSGLFARMGHGHGKSYAQASALAAFGHVPIVPDPDQPEGVASFRDADGREVGTIDLSKLNDAQPGWDDASLFGDQLPQGQPRFQATPSAATRAKARAKRKRRKR